MEDDSNMNSSAPAEHNSDISDKPEESASSAASTTWTLKIKTPNQEKQVEVDEEAKVKAVSSVLPVGYEQSIGRYTWLTDWVKYPVSVVSLFLTVFRPFPVCLRNRSLSR